MKNKEFAKALALFSRASHVGEVLALRSGGTKLSDEARDAMLAKCAAGEYVELEIDYVAYEQKTGVPNRNFVRFRDGLMTGLGRSGASKPFMRDHEQGNSLARGGTITASSTEKIGDGHYAIKQTAKLTAPWAVEMALRGLLSTVSIGWNPTGDVTCSAHNAPVFTKCYCWPGDRLAMKANDAGEKRLVRDRGGEITVEWVYTQAELVETSQVSVPGVPSAQVDEIRASLSAHFSGEEPRGEDKHMLARLAAILCLAATASEDDVIRAVETKVKEGATDKTELSIAKGELAIAKTELEVFKSEKLKTDEDKFITDALSTGRISVGADKEWRTLFGLSAERAKTLMAEKPAGSATPVGLPRQSGGKEPPPAADPQLAGAQPVIERLGGTLDGVRKNMRQSGMSDVEIDAALAKHVAPAARKGA